MDNKILEAIRKLSPNNEPVPTLAIAKEVIEVSPTCAKVNPQLYSLQKEGKIKKTAEPNGSKPKWSLVI